METENSPETKFPASRFAQVALVFTVFFKLGCTSFGGPAAHIGFFQKEFVERRQWLTLEYFTQLLAMSQFLPGPSSSQLGFCIGLYKAGLAGAIAAFVAFTLPSVVLLCLFAEWVLSGSFTESENGLAVLHALKLLAAIVVADAVLAMARNFCVDWKTRLFALLTFAAVLTAVGAKLGFGQYLPLACIVLAAIAGSFVFKVRAHESAYQLKPSSTISKKLAVSAGLALLIGFFGIPSLAHLSDVLQQQGMKMGGLALIQPINTLFQTGSLVFGGGHVVLPLLEPSMVDKGWVSLERFVSGYGAAQAIPGPLFAFSAYLAYIMSFEGLFAGIVPAWVLVFACLLILFLPGFLLCIAVWPHWHSITKRASMRSAITGVNASVVGLLAATWVTPVASSAIFSAFDALIIVIGFILSRYKANNVLWLLAYCLMSSLVLLRF